MAIHGFQSNATIQSAFWWYKPAPVDLEDLETILDISQIIKVETTKTHDKVWLYYSTSSDANTNQPFTLNGAVAKAFMKDMEAMFA